jgi:diketogulonate reductase-like aldo/keto reductase
MSEPNIILNTGAQMPQVGLGTWKSAPEEVGQAVEYALAEAGYNHIDCAAIYRNEKEIGQAFKKVFGTGARRREDVFITSKLWNTEHPRQRVRAACEKTLSDLNLEYLDLYLMHWGLAIPPYEGEPTNPHGRYTEQLDENGFLIGEKISVRETWEAMEGLVKDGLVKAIGVANFTGPMLVDLFTYAATIPAMNQIELHPYLPQQELIDFCHSKNIAVTAYAPLGSPGNSKPKGLPAIMEDKTIVNIAASHGKTPSQILIRWAIQRGTVVIPKSIARARIKENIQVFDFELSEPDMQAMAGLNRNLRFVNPAVWWKIPYFN